MGMRRHEERVVDVRTCPTCGHVHPNGIGSATCLCDDRALLWTPVPRRLLDDEARRRLEELEEEAT